MVSLGQCGRGKLGCRSFPSTLVCPASESRESATRTTGSQIPRTARSSTRGRRDDSRLVATHRPETRPKHLDAEAAMFHTYKRTRAAQSFHHTIAFTAGATLPQLALAQAGAAQSHTQFWASIIRLAHSSSRSLKSTKRRIATERATTRQKGNCRRQNQCTATPAASATLSRHLFGYVRDGTGHNVSVGRRESSPLRRHRSA